MAPIDYKVRLIPRDSAGNEFDLSKTLGEAKYRGSSSYGSGYGSGYRSGYGAGSYGSGYRSGYGSHGSGYRGSGYRGSGLSWLLTGALLGSSSSSNSTSSGISKSAGKTFGIIAGVLGGIFLLGVICAGIAECLKNTSRNQAKKARQQNTTIPPVEPPVELHTMPQQQTPTDCPIEKPAPAYHSEPPPDYKPMPDPPNLNSRIR